MAELTITDLAKKMQGIDIAIFSTTTDGGAIASRPMSNNGDVEYDGDSIFFAYGDSRIARDIAADPKVSLGFSGKPGLLGQPGIVVTVQGEAELIRDRATMDRHWAKDLDRYFPDGLDTPGIVMIKVHAGRIHYWDGGDEGEILA